LGKDFIVQFYGSSKKYKHAQGEGILSNHLRDKYKDYRDAIISINGWSLFEHRYKRRISKRPISHV
jgi:hypothetical protein